jgi:methionine-rich copper-binding protein CopC
MEPPEGAVVQAADAPRKVTMSFVGSLETAFSGIEVLDGGGKKVSGKTVFTESDSVMEVELKGGLTPGEYTVQWRCMSLDGHSQKGSYTFTVK